MLIRCFIVLLFCATAHAAKKRAQPVVEKPLAPEEAARTMQVPEGFNVTLFAG